jgi:hypothetical protein
MPAADEPAKTDPQAADKVIADLKRIGDLIKQLDHDKFEIRQKATDELVKIGRPAVEPLKMLLASRPNLELAKRASGILEAMPKEKVGKLSTAALIAALHKPIDLDKGVDANTPLRDVLEFLTENRVDVPFIVDSKAFESIGIQKVEEQPVSLPKMTGVRLKDVLRLLLQQMRGDVYTGDFLVRSGYVEITTTYHSQVETLGCEPTDLAAAEDPPGMVGPPETTARAPVGLPRILKIVHVHCDRQPLKDSLQELSEMSGASIVIDPRVGDKAKTAVSITLANAMVDSAVELLADMADLQVVQKDAIFYVTTKENANRLENQRRPKRFSIPPGMRPGGGPPAQ